MNIKKSLRSFFINVRKSLIPDDTFYPQILTHRTIRSSIGYLASLVYILAVILGTCTLFSLGPVLSPDKFEHEVTQMLRQFPQKGFLMLNDEGILTNTYDRPIVIFGSGKNELKKMLIVDTQANDQTYIENPPFVLLSRKDAYVNSYEGMVKIPYKRNQSMMFNTQSIHNLESLISHGFNFYWFMFILALIAVLVVFPLMAILSKLLYLLVISFIIFLTLRIFVKKLTFKNTFHIGLYALTGPVILENFALLMGISIPVKIWFLLITVAFFTAAIYETYMIPTSHKKTT